MKAALPTLTGNATIKVSVITSSHSERLIADLLAELWALRTYAIDVYPRGMDIQRALDNISLEELEGTSLIKRFAEEGNNKGFIEKMGQYVINQKKAACKEVQKVFGERPLPDSFRIPAIATFFPEISSLSDEKQRERAGEALVGAVRLASVLKAKVVEFVLGRTVERCRKKLDRKLEVPEGLQCEFVHTSTPQSRIKKAVEILAETVCPEARKWGVKLAAEIEPGFSCVLNSPSNVEHFLSEVGNAHIEDVVGLNLDIGHLLILSHSPKDCILPTTAAGWVKHIYHAHASDNIGHHFRDLVPGTLHSLDSREEERSFRKWIEVCAECADQNRAFSGYIAVELEGCNRIQWIQRSVLRLSYLIREVCGSSQSRGKVPL